jgi:hypothetical protein
LVEQLTVNQRVAGSSPAGGAKYRIAALSAALYPSCLRFSLKNPALGLAYKAFVTLPRCGKIGVERSTNNVSNSIGRYIHGLIGVTATWERAEMRMESQ